LPKERENFEVLSDADASAKRLARIEKKIETLREQRKDFIDDYIAQKRRQNKAHPRTAQGMAG